jgi:hypothetical protein
MNRSMLDSAHLLRNLLRGSDPVSGPLCWPTKSGWAKPE